MDDKLRAWARRVKRRRTRRGCGGGLPTLWLFTDAARLPDPLPAIARLPRGGAGVVLRPEAMSLATMHQIAALCRERRLRLVVAADARLARRLHAGLHLRGGRRPHPWPPGSEVLTGSAHTVAEAVRCRRAGARLIFVSPLFATASHPGAAALGVVRWLRIAHACGWQRCAALGGVDARSVARLPRMCAAVGAIGALGR